ncbi:hypothetical protein PPL_05334 [Heterostelium album PN500]|uniref:Peptidase S9 prolyl oligopeptidase catalytic domain-containing protein n=1 Tax=Heterostelium pallidum (strain ATCC 26659 / Pp 5 / PN500) TaxID=670386 RepID=D3B9W4_HETP5|nr:hypothetical protein PPL_05334 [Heterostelium album PN500]EFA81351.1 hypothetical protein PPL_05334 [Heterostelium album PN500]|eukprot:XP_020433469.1 hypothetical protein PPL_05334 [Heterostelium album PN500]
MWILFPTGRRSWGYDWQSASRLNIFSALASLASQLPGVPTQLKSAYEIDPTKLLVTGHSMGSYGCFSFTSHFGDLALGSACAAGFAKLEEYIYYNTRPSFERLDPVLKGLFMASIAESDADLYSSSMVGIPLLVRYGQNDTVVSPWHSRRMARLVSENSGDPNAVMISEVPNQGHWFSFMLDDPLMSQFYSNISSARHMLPAIPEDLIIVTNNPASSGSRANILILQTLIPSRVARISIKQLNDSVDGLVWRLSTQNVRRFGFTKSPDRPLPNKIIIDKMVFDTTFLPEQHYFRTKKGSLQSWVATGDNGWTTKERSAATYGPMRQIFEKQFTIIYGTMDESLTSQMQWSAIWISNYFNTYGRGSPSIYSDQEFQPTTTTGDCSQSTAAANYILIGNSNQNLFVEKYQEYMPLKFGDNNSFSIGEYQFEGNLGIGITFLSPNQCGDGLFLVVAGTDSQGLSNALHTVPQRSGVTAPDFLIVSDDWRSSGLSSTIATGLVYCKLGVIISHDDQSSITLLSGETMTQQQIYLKAIECTPTCTNSYYILQRQCQMYQCNRTWFKVTFCIAFFGIRYEIKRNSDIQQ